MNAFPYLDAWLQCLLQLAPPRGLIHVGAGGGSALQYPFASMPRLLAVEADAAQHARLQAQLQNHAQCQLVQAVVASQPGIADYYNQSQSNENGLCPAADLQALWPSIKTVRAEQLPATTLQILLDQAPGGAASFNWAVIDCLPAGDVLRGAGKLPEALDVVVVRALKDTPAGADTAAQAMSLPPLRQQLAAFGLEFVALEEENHPRLVRALFVRNPNQQLDKDKATFAAALGAQTRLTAERHAALTALQAQHDSLTHEKSKLIANNEELTRARDQLVTQRDAEAQAKTEAITQRDAEAAAKAALAAARDEQARIAADQQAALTALQAQSESLTQENSKLIANNEELARARDQLVTQRDAEAQAKTEAITQRDAEAAAKAALAAARDEQARIAADQQAALTALQAQSESLTQEKSKLIADNEELARARAELGTQRDAESKAKAEALAQRDQLANDKAALTAARDEQAKLATDRQTALATQQQDTASKQQRLQQLEADNQEHAARQHMLQEELIKAEAQIELIKDLLLREPGL
ncbi:hypothetical protein [Rhodoferax sp.]|uniref:hypothetical protein n=1 Tax=Rhodoferax sp. TaxID=50421 RepID=UPI00276F6160|nr:hypothetical protein [Rhodoferax sp.]